MKERSHELDGAAGSNAAAGELIEMAANVGVPGGNSGAGGKALPAPALTLISDNVYRADGSPAQGSVLITWGAFTTAAGQAVAAGSLVVQLDASGGFNASLAANTGATPAGTYYRATYKLEDGSTQSEYWVVPATQSTTIGAIRSKLVPANQAAQFLTRDFADSNYMNLSSSQTIAGVKTFSASPAVPTPQNPTDSANKAYVDANSGSVNLSSPPPIGTVAPNTIAATTATASDLRTANYPVMDLRNYGLTGDGVLLTSCSMTHGQSLLSCTGASFTAGDVGKAAFVPNAGTGGAFLNTKIASYQSATQVTLAATAMADVSNGALWYGTDNTQAWCQAMNCNSATVPNTVFTSQPGRKIVLARGTYFISCNTPTSNGYCGAYTRNGDVLQGAGQSGTEVLLFDPSGLAHDLCLGGNASAGPGSCTTDALNGRGEGAGLANGVEGIFWANPEGSTTGSCVYVNNVSGFEIKENWFDCNIGVNVVNSNIGTIVRNTFDGSNNQGVILKGNGASQDNPSHSLIVAENQFFAQKWYCMQLDGIGGATIANNNFDYCKQYGLLINSPEAYTSYNVTVANNNFVTSTSPAYYVNTQQHVVIQTPLVDSLFSGNTFQLSRAGDVTVASSGVTNLTLSDNTFKNGQAGSLTVTAAGAGLKVTKNSWMAPGQYAAQFSSPAVVQGNYCSNPFAVSGLPSNDYDKGCFRFVGASAGNFKANDNVTDSASVAALAIHADAFPAYTSGNRSNWATADVYVYTANGPIASANERAYNGGAPAGAGFTTNIDPGTGNASFAGSGSFSGNMSVAGDLTMRDVPGVEYLVSKYANLQAAINAAYNGGSVLGTVVDDRLTPYTGPGFTVPDSVTLKLAATTYTINSTVTFNNGNNNVTAGIVMQPGAHMAGASTSTNHGTIITAGNGLNADLIATSSVGTGIGAGAQWWHWGGLENLRIIGNGANQTAGNCLNVENMGETAYLRSIEVSGCKVDNIVFTGASATASDIQNITTNGAGRYGMNFNNLAGIAVVHGLSGDSNATSIVRLNGGQSGTLTILGFKTEEEISGQDPLITIDEAGQNGAQPSLFIVGGYTFGRAGVNDVIKYVNGTAGTTPYVSVSNFYVQNYVNAINDVVNGRTTQAANMNKVPFYYGPTGAFFSGQAFTLDLNTFVQSPHSGNGILTEVFGTTSSNETMIAASGNSTNIGTGGIGFRMPNRANFGQQPEQFAKMTYAFPGGVPNNQQWEFIPTKAAGDASTRWIGDPGYRWDEVYAMDMNSTTATIGTLNVTTCNGCGTAGGAPTWGSIGGTLSSQTDLNAALNAKANTAGLATVATSGSYSDLSNKPALATVATSGSYSDLSNKPALATVATSGSYSDLSNKPALATVATSGSYSDLSNKPAIPAVGMHLIAGTLLGTAGAITGNGADQNVFSVSLPAGTFAVGTGVKCYARFGHSGTVSVTHKWFLGTTMIASQPENNSTQNEMAELEIFTPASLTSQLNDVGPLVASNTIAAGPQVGLSSAENLNNAATLKFTFNVASTDTVTPKAFYCTTLQ